MIVLINNEDEDNDDAIGPESIDNCGNTREIDIKLNSCSFLGNKKK